MRISVILLLAIAALGIGGYYWGLADRAASPQFDQFSWAKQREPAPPLTVSDAAGAPVSLADFRGRAVLVNLWATWCAPCLIEMPALDRLQAEFADRPFAVLPISIDRDGLQKIEGFYQAAGIERLPILLDPKMSAPQAFQAAGMPTSILIDAEGRIVGRLAGEAEWDSPAAIELIESVLPPAED